MKYKDRQWLETIINRKLTSIVRTKNNCWATTCGVSTSGPCSIIITHLRQPKVHMLDPTSLLVGWG